MENWFLRITQMLVFVAVSGTAASYKVTTNGMLIGVWGLLAAIAWTMIYAKACDWYLARKYGWASPFPPRTVIWSVTWKVVAVTVAWLAACAAAIAVLMWWNGISWGS